MRKYVLLITGIAWTFASVEAQLSDNWYAGLGGTLLHQRLTYNETDKVINQSVQVKMGFMEAQVSPEAGYFIRRNLLVGAGGRYLYHKENFSFKADPDFDLTAEAIYKLYGGSVFVRKYYPVRKRVYLNLTLYGGWSSGKIRTKYEGSSGFPGEEGKMVMADAGLRGGVTCRTKRRLSLEAGLLLAGYNFYHYDLGNSDYVREQKGGQVTLFTSQVNVWFGAGYYIFQERKRPIIGTPSF